MVRDDSTPTAAHLLSLVEFIHRLNPDIVLLQHFGLFDLNHLRPHLNRFLISFGQPSGGIEGGLGILLRNHLDVLRTDHRYFHQVDGSKSTGLGQTLLLTFDGRQLLLGNVQLSFDSASSDSHMGIYEAKQFFAGLPLRSIHGALIGGHWNAGSAHPLIQLPKGYGLYGVRPHEHGSFSAVESANPMIHFFCSTSLKSTALNMSDFEMRAQDVRLPHPLVFQISWLA